MNETIITALIGIVGGGFLLELLRRIVPPAERRLEEGAAIRAELRSEIATLRADVVRLAASVDEWQRKYYELAGEHAEMKIELHALRSQADKANAKLEGGQ